VRPIIRYKGNGLRACWDTTPVSAGKQSCDIVVVLRRWDVCEKGAIKVYFSVVEVRVGWVVPGPVDPGGTLGGVFLDITSRYSAPEAWNLKSL